MSVARLFNHSLIALVPSSFINLCSGISLLAVRRVVLYFTTRCPSRALMTGKTVVITGANCGIGYQTALDLAYRDARVILACRDLKKGQHAAKRIATLSRNEQVVAKKLDLASLESVRTFCSDIKSTEAKLDVLINNAGVMNCPYALTEDGLETHMAVNHFSNVLLTNLLKEHLEKSESSRVVFVSSSLLKYGTVDFDKLHTKEWHARGKSYADSKLLNILYAREFQKRANDNGKITVYSVSPGMVVTRLGRHTLLFNRFFQIFGFPVFVLLYSLYTLLIKTAREGSQTVIYCSVAPEVEGKGGLYRNFTKIPWFDKANDEALATKVYDFSQKAVGL